MLDSDRTSAGLLILGASGLSGIISVMLSSSTGIGPALLRGEKSSSAFSCAAVRVVAVDTAVGPEKYAERPGSDGLNVALANLVERSRLDGRLDSSGSLSRKSGMWGDGGFGSRRRFSAAVLDVGADLAGPVGAGGSRAVDESALEVLRKA